ncbi:MAG TPA: response regulator transcription factor [Acidobacteriota bacterium]|nr:response regulator transcription factor [Acidobacteriota bacterium]
MRVLIADDHAALRKGLIQIISDAYPNTEFIEASNTPNTIKLLLQGQYDLVILDIFMPGRSGLEVLHEAKGIKPSPPVLVLSSAPEDQMAIRVLKAGADGYLNKQAATEDLVLAVAKLVSGGRYVSSSLAEQLAGQLTTSDRPPHYTLSDREYTVLQLLVSGKSIKEIAFELSLSPKTVSTFHSRIWEKLHVNNDIELFRYAIEHNLTDKR